MQGVERLTVTLPVELAERARQAVADGSADSVSAYVREAVEARSGHLETDRAWAEHFAANGSPQRVHYEFALRQLLGKEPSRELVDEMIRRDAELVARHRRPSS
jgi:Arc/MetJ-type ribon-helix-helix transcriptional regulator